MEEPVSVECPWCGECFDTFFDNSSGAQTYIEDCQVCCRPIQMAFRLRRDGSAQVSCERT